jgi:hypothetical protein
MLTFWISEPSSYLESYPVRWCAAPRRVDLNQARPLSYPPETLAGMHITPSTFGTTPPRPCWHCHQFVGMAYRGTDYVPLPDSAVEMFG